MSPMAAPASTGPRRPATARASRAIALAAAALGVAAAHPAAAGPRRKGKVVRVSRELPRVSTSLRWCGLYDLEVGTCTTPVEVGDTGLVVDNEGNYGRARVIESHPVYDDCGTATAWQIVIDTSALSQRDYSYSAILVLDHEVAPLGRTLSTSAELRDARPGEVVNQVLDDDGDGRADLVISQFACDQHGQPADVDGASHGCTSYWVSVRGDWRVARTDSTAVCRP